MARTDAHGCWLIDQPRRDRVRAARPAAGFRAVFAALILALLLSPFSLAHAQQPVRGDATLANGGGYARLLVKLEEDVESEVVTAGQILVIRFKRPVAVPMDKVADALPDYVGSARRDPDGMAVRIALSRKVSVNTMVAGERLFVDLLPDTWTGAPPALPADVVKELAERARAAERALRERQLAAELKKRPPVRVRAAVQPTFVRFTFELPDGSGVSSTLNAQKLTLLFNSAFNFDLADAKVSAPSNISSIDQKIEGDTSTVELTVVGNVDVHTFREEKNYVIDIGFQQADKPRAQAIPESKPPARATPPPMPAAEATPAPQQKSEAAAQPPQTVLETKPVEPKAAEAKPADVKPADARPQPKIEPAESRPAAKAESAPAPAAPAVAPSPAAAPSPPPAQAAAPAAPPAEPVKLDVRRRSDNFALSFAFPSATPAALFRRADTVWLVFDSNKPIDIEPIRAEGGSLIADVNTMALPRGQAVRIRLNRPQLFSLGGDERTWTLTMADASQEPPQPIWSTRNVGDPSRANLAIQLLNPGLVHRIVDPDAGDSMFVVTANLPARGFIRRQDFVEFTLLDTMHGVAVLPKSEDVSVDTSAGNVVVNRPGGMTISPASTGPERATASVRPIFDNVQWRELQQDDFFKRRQEMIAATFTANEEAKLNARLDLARFYMSRNLYHEAKGILRMALSDQKPGQEDPATLIMHAVASALVGQAEQSLKDLNNPAVGSNFDSQLWKGLALAKQEKWIEAREKFKNSEFSITSLPFDLQRVALTNAMRAAIEVKDYSSASNRSNELDIVGVTPEAQPGVAVLRGRLAEALKREKDALREYASAVQSSNREAATEARLLEIALQLKRNEIKDEDVLKELETLAVMWRGDRLEIRTLQLLFQIYAGRDRYADAFAAARAATQLQANSAASRELQDEAASMFTQVFLTAKGDDIPAIEALALFFEYRELTPIGRRGDELIRRLTERLVNIDLLDQASELLQYQIDHRLEGAARAQVASKLAMIYLMNRKPDRAVSAIRSTRIADLAGELRQQRLLLEARAQSDIGRHDLALDIISSSNGREAVRLRSDIHWAARRWRESSEQIELYYGDRWRDFTALNPVEKSDIIRAAIGYALADDSLGLARFREKYAPLMSGETDKVMFDLASKPATASSAEYAQIAKLAATVDTLEGFLRDMRTRFPDAIARANSPGQQRPDPSPTGSVTQIKGSLPQIKGTRIAR